MSEQLFLPAPKLEKSATVKRSRRLLGFGMLTVLIATFTLIYGSQQKEWLANLTISDLQISDSSGLMALREAQNAVLEKNMTGLEVIVSHGDGEADTIIKTTLSDLGFEYRLNEEYFEQDDLERITPFFSDEKVSHGSAPEIASLEMDQKKWGNFLSELEDLVNVDAEAASLEWNGFEWEMNNGVQGRELNLKKAARSFERLATLVQRDNIPEKLSLSTQSFQPLTDEATSEQLTQQYEAIQSLIGLPVVLQLGDESFPLELSQEEMIRLTEDGGAEINREALITLLTPIAESFFRETNTIRITGKEEVRYGAFQAITEGEYTEGRRVNVEELADQIINELLVVPEDEELTERRIFGKVYEIPLKVYSELDEMEYDLLSVGYSEYSKGNAANRVHNIETGLNRINGSIIDPGAKISFNRMNGPINNDFRTGYAIFGATAKPSLGGGICQVSTTFYRSLLNMGTPISMRQNHSWDLSYYRAGGYGLDATIFPSVGLDVKGINDFGSHLFFYAYNRPETEEAFVLVYGKGDGRKVTLEPEEEYIPFYGAKTLKWTQTVEMPDGEVIMNDIVSRYRM